MKFIYTILILFSLIPIISCATVSYDLSTPEKAHQTYMYAFKTRNYDLMRKCLHREEDLKLIDAVEKKNAIPYKLKVLKNTIIDKVIINDDEVVLKFEEIGYFESSIDEEPYIYVSIAEVLFKNIKNEWKYDSELSSGFIQLMKKEDDMFIPIDLKNR